MKKSTTLHLIVSTVLLAGALLFALLGSHISTSTPAHAAPAQPATVARWIPCRVWDRCPITQYYGQNGEHGIDLFTDGLPITAMLSGTVTFARWLCWPGTRECIWDITWKLDHPWLARGSPFMYVQIDVKAPWIVRGIHINAGAYLGYSRVFIEFGLTPDKEYGVSGWHWGINPLTVWPWL